jgi:hypothetical protein
VPAARGETIALNLSSGRNISMFAAKGSSMARQASALSAAGIVAAGALVAAADPASAGPASSLTAKYKVTGSTFLVGPNTTLELGPGHLTAKVPASGNTITLKLGKAKLG